MESAFYTTLTRQSGLMREMQTIANNIANSSTTGYRQEGLIFAEHIVGVENGPSLSMATANVRNTSYAQGTITQTGGALDLAIEGDGFFLIETPAGERLTRNGSFAVSAEGDLVTNDGYRVLDAGGAPVFIPPDGTLGISGDGTISSDGRLIGQVGLVMPTDMTAMVREGGVMFRSDAGVEPVLDPLIRQGFLESSNVDPLGQIARMIEVQRAYEMGQSFIEAEHERIRTALQTFVAK
ncbi:flagellar basal body rod protein FlgF [Roseovarius atlanticus]|uniref:Flagellar basal-body rod protein FlgF n=1 Tax=Roseovarius atlanticus TaxID=1641875 RepID=A0A0T5NQT2_9RHOB|nr:flagellar hook-basal body complex protein [Roseovarius atlanticus]KRS11314.1 flagellar basal body rod protein FlgF [Roseovarius atlanticus]